MPKTKTDALVVHPDDFAALIEAVSPFVDTHGLCMLAVFPWNYINQLKDIFHQAIRVWKPGAILYCEGYDLLGRKKKLSLIIDPPLEV